MKILTDTLTNPQNGRFSRKSATSLYCFAMSFVCFVMDTLSRYQVKDIYFETFFWGGMAMLGVTVGEKLGKLAVAGNPVEKKEREAEA